MKALILLRKKLLFLKRQIQSYGYKKDIDFKNTIDKEIIEVKEAIEELDELNNSKVSRLCKNCESWQNQCCMQTEFENGTKADDECFIIGFKAKQ